MITFKEYINESINDKGILKAIFVVGIAASGKSWTIKRLKGSISPKVVNTDTAHMKLAKDANVRADKAAWDMHGPKAKELTVKSLAHYLNSMLPLFIDGTTSNMNMILNRIRILKSVGYDVGVIYIDSDVTTSKMRAVSREEEENRRVEPEFIEKDDDSAAKKKAFLKADLDFFQVITNAPVPMDEAEVDAIFKRVQKFYASPVKRGDEIVAKLKAVKAAYLTPTILSVDDLNEKVSSWYRK